jgi:hypothetical protein
MYVKVSAGPDVPDRVVAEAFNGSISTGEFELSRMGLGNNYQACIGAPQGQFRLRARSESASETLHDEDGDYNGILNIIDMCELQYGDGKSARSAAKRGKSADKSKGKSSPPAQSRSTKSGKKAAAKKSLPRKAVKSGTSRKKAAKTSARPKSAKNKAGTAARVKPRKAARKTARR